MNQHQDQDRSSLAPIKLGRVGPQVFPLALGCMSFSGMYGDSDEREGVATIHAALDRGVNLLDTGDFYGCGYNELLIGRALRDRRDRALLSVKFGVLRAPGGGWGGLDSRPAALKNFLTYSLTRLGVDYLDIYRPSRLDPAVPIEETVGALADLVKAGYLRGIGLSEVGPETIRRAQAVHPITDLQIEYSLLSRGPERQILPLLQQLGIGLTAYGVLSRGLLTGARPRGAGDFRASLPRFSEENRARNQPLVEALERLAAARGVRPAHLAIAWVRAKGPHIVPLIGARTPAQITECLAAAELVLSAEEVASLERAIPAQAVAGARYQDALMQYLDSER